MVARDTLVWRYNGFCLQRDHHVIKALNDFMDKNLSMYVTILPSLVAIGTVIVEIY